MEHKQSIPIKDLVVDSWQLELLLSELCSYYPPAVTLKPALGTFELTTYDRDLRANTVKTPPKHFQRLFATPLKKIEMLFTSEMPNRKVVCRLTHGGTHASENVIELTSDDEAWLVQAGDRLSAILAKFAPQSVFLERSKYWLPFVTALPLGWGVLHLGAYLLVLREGPASEMPFKSMAMVSLYLWSFGVGLLCSLFLFKWLSRMYPSVELRMGHPHEWTYKRWRAGALAVTAATLAAAVGYFGYAVYHVSL